MHVAIADQQAMGPNDIVVNRWDLNHLLWTLAWHPVPSQRHERNDLERCTDRLMAAMLAAPGRQTPPPAGRARAGTGTPTPHASACGRAGASPTASETARSARSGR